MTARRRSVVDDVLSVPSAARGRSLAQVQAERAEQARREAVNARRRERRAEAKAERRYRRAERPADATAPARVDVPVQQSDPLEVVRRVRVVRGGPVVVLEVARDGSVVCPMCRERQPLAVVLEHLGVPAVPERLSLAEVVARQHAESPPVLPVDGGFFGGSW